MQGEAPIDDFVAVGDAIREIPPVDIHFGVQVEFCQQRPGSSLRGSAIRNLCRGQQLVFDGFQLALDVGEQILRKYLLREKSTYLVLFGHERHVAEEVECVPVAQGTQEAGLCAIDRHIRPNVGGHVPAGEQVVRSLAEKLIAERYLIKNTAVKCVDEHIARPPVLFVEVLDGLVVPADDGLVGRQFLVVPVAAQVLAEAIVNTADVAGTGAGRAGNRQASVQFGQHSLVRCRVVIDDFRRELVLVNGDGIQVLETGRKGQHGPCQDGEI